MRLLPNVILLAIIASACDSDTATANDAALDALPDAGADGQTALPDGSDGRGEPTEMLPDFRFSLVAATAEVSVDGKTYMFSGLPNTYWGAMSTDDIPQDAKVGNCSLLKSADDKVIASADFHRWFERTRFDSFSFADDGDSTVVWGLYDATTGQEWSAAGGPAISIEMFFERSEGELTAVLSFAGEASENQTTAKSPAESVVTCVYHTK